jgi:predicted acetyltransferase
MEKLLIASFEVMKEKKYDYSFLIPQEKGLFDFYAKYGYRPFSSDPSYSATSVSRGEGTAVKSYTRPDEIDNGAFYVVYLRFLMEKTNVVLKTKLQVSHILWDFFNEGGILFANDWGFAFTFEENRKIIKKEFFYPTDEIKAKFLKTISEYYQSDEPIGLNHPAKDAGMIKRLNPSSLLPAGIYMSMMLD